MKPLRVLIVEDSEDDALLLVRELKRGGYEPTYERVDTAEDMKSALAKQKWDIVIADYSMPHFSGMKAVEILKESKLDLPFILVSGTIGEETAVAAMKAGAHDYIMKKNMVRFISAVKRELHEAKLREERRCIAAMLRESEERFRLIVENVKDYAIYMLSPEGDIVSWNAGAEGIKGYRAEEIIGRHFSCFYPAEDIEQGKPEHNLRTAASKGRVEFEGWRIRKDGSRFWGDVVITALRDENGELRGFSKVTRDITERKRAEEALQKAHRRVSVLYTIDRAASRSLDLDEVLNDALKATLDALGIEAGGIFILEPGGKSLALRIHSGLSEEFVKNVQRIKLGEGISGKAAAEKKPVVLEVSEYPTKRLAPFILREGLETMASTPLISGGRVLGALNLGTRQTRAFPPEELELLTSIGQQLGAAIQNALLHEKVHQSEEKYRLLIENIQDGIFIIQDAKMKYVNEAFAKMAGYNVEEVIGKDFRELVAPEDLEMVADRYQRRQAGEKVPREYEFRMLHRDGKTRIIVNMAVGLIDYQGRVASIGTVKDVTERKLHEEKLRESEEKFRNISERSYDVIITADSEGRFTYISPAANRVLNFQPEEIIGKPFHSIISESNISMANQAFNEVMNGNNIENLQVKLSRKDGTLVTVEGNANPIIIEGKVVGAQGIFRDISDRKRAEEALETALNNWQDTFNAISDSVFILDTEGRIVLSNGAFERKFGLNTEDVIGQHCYNIVHGAEDFIEDCPFKRMMQTGMRESLEFHYKEHGLWFYITADPVYTKSGEIINAVHIMYDITELKKADETRLENERLAYASKAKSDFLASMSHELRTPLNAILGFSELMLQKIPGALNEKQEGYVRDIYASGTHLLNLINDILDLSKIEAGKIELAVEKLSVPQTINEGFTLVKEKAMKHNITLRTELDSELEFIEADKQRFKQILFNLLSNAVKFSKPEGGTVTISTKKEKDVAKFSVKDTGIGIKEEDIGRLFKEFEQLDTGISRKYGGTGLGLAITKQLVELHEGKIWAESKFGEGSTFTFLLPLKAKGSE